MLTFSIEVNVQYYAIMSALLIGKIVIPMPVHRLLGIIYEYHLHRGMMPCAHLNIPWIDWRGKQQESTSGHCKKNRMIMSAPPTSLNPSAPCMEYLPTFAWKIIQMQVNIPYMEHLEKKGGNFRCFAQNKSLRVSVICLVHRGRRHCAYRRGFAEHRHSLDLLSILVSTSTVFAKFYD